jgi:hypothetical protein
MQAAALSGCLSSMLVKGSILSRPFDKSRRLRCAGYAGAQVKFSFSERIAQKALAGFPYFMASFDFSDRAF